MVLPQNKNLDYFLAEGFDQNEAQNLAESEANRIKLLFENASLDSKFHVSRLMNLNNFNRSHMAVNNLPDLGNSIISGILDSYNNENEKYQGGHPEI